ncbi:MAG: hypothetical protein ABWY33_08825, partial [Cellulomonas sp.]
MPDAAVRRAEGSDASAGLLAAVGVGVEVGAGGGEGPSAALIDLIAALESLKSAACALQAEAAVELDRAERHRQALAGVPARRRGLGVAAQIGLARRESPHR